MNINYKDTPFPYFYGSLDKNMYDYAHKLWSTDEDLKSYNISKNRSNIEITDKKLINYQIDLPNNFDTKNKKKAFSANLRISIINELVINND